MTQTWSHIGRMVFLFGLIMFRRGLSLTVRVLVMFTLVSCSSNEHKLGSQTSQQSTVHSEGPSVGRAPMSTICGRPFYASNANPSQTITVTRDLRMQANPLPLEVHGIQGPPLVIIVSQDCTTGAEVTISLKSFLTVLATVSASDGRPAAIALQGGTVSGVGIVTIGPPTSPTAIVEVPVSRSHDS